MLALRQSRCLNRISDSKLFRIKLGKTAKLSSPVVLASASRRVTEFAGQDSLPEVGYINAQNVNPDINDEEWIDRISDWNEFWSHDVWEKETEDLDDEHDARVKQMPPQERMWRMLNSLQNTDKKAQIVYLAQIANLQEHVPGYHFVDPVPDHRSSLYDNLSIADLRAISEKRKKRAQAEEEKLRHQARQRRLQRPNHEADYRLWSEETVKLNSSWTDEEIQKLITLDGLNLDPKKHGARIQNPWFPVDYANEMGNRYIEETEEFLQRTGHWALPTTAGYLSYEVEMKEEDFEDFDDAVVGVELDDVDDISPDEVLASALDFDFDVDEDEDGDGDGDEDV